MMMDDEPGLTTTVSTVTIPVLRETLRVETRVVDRGGAAVHLRVSERDEAVEQLLRQDELSVERVVVGRVVDRAPPVREEDGVTIIPVLEEELVITTRLVLKEEIRVRRTTRSTPWKDTVRLREEHAVVETIGVTEAAAEPIGGMDVMQPTHQE